MDSRRRAATVGAQEGDLEARLAAATVHRRAPLASTAAKPTSRLEESDEHVVDYTGDDADANVEAGAHGQSLRLLSRGPSLCCVRPLALLCVSLVVLL